MSESHSRSYHALPLDERKTDELQELKHMIYQMQNRIDTLLETNNKQDVTLQRQFTSLNIPATEDEIDDKYDKNTISLNRDIYMAFLVLLAYGGYWDMKVNDQRKFVCMVYFCMFIQGGTLFFLFLEMVMDPPWDNYSPDAGFSWLVISIKAFAMLCFSAYIWRDIVNIVQSYSLTRAENVREFSKGSAKGFTFFLLCFSFPLYLVASALSVGLITTAETGFDAVLNAVGITFVLEIDDWMYQFIHSHVYIKDELFDVTYERPKETKRRRTKRHSLDHHYFLYICLRNCLRKSSENVAVVSNDIPEISRRFKGLFMVYSFCLLASIIFAGYHYEVPLMLWIGAVGASIIGAIGCVSQCMWFNWLCFCWVPRNREEKDAFFNDIVPDICEKYEIDVNNLNKDDEEKFVMECMDYAYDNYIGFRSDIYTMEYFRLLFAEHTMKHIVDAVYKKELYPSDIDDVNEQSKIDAQLVTDCMQYVDTIYPNDDKRNVKKGYVISRCKDKKWWDVIVPTIYEQHKDKATTSDDDEKRKQFVAACTDYAKKNEFNISAKKIQRLNAYFDKPQTEN